MLELKNIKKDYYLKDQEPVHALKGISLNFRRNEFVAVLGHSGCGKTTLLNIIGGLDKYTSGDLIINGKSTKTYKDRDWDTYRNHSIGFVFQSYNLIPHQTVLGNVELALTIAGISKKERRERAKQALEMVGLKGYYHKKPNQMSGGQMQRVAIARSLVNNPEILLADEPTGALDSETSIQIMDLLKEVAKDRLVIMVTHNPDLAYKYANRIVKISDGEVIDDSNPFDGKEEVIVDNTNKGKKSAMKLVTATSLSLSNLLAKMKRTILVVIAGSIGIVGVSAVLSVSNGVQNYIDDMQNDMLSSYPITISEESVDYTSLMTGMSSNIDTDVLDFDITTEVGMSSMINYLMTAYKDITSVKTNTIDKDLVDYISNISSEDAAVIKYDYGIDTTNNIFTSWDYSDTDNRTISLNGLTQAYIAELKTVDGFSEYASYVDLFTDFMKGLPDNSDYILEQYDLLGDSKLATEENEIMLVLDSDTTLTDLVLAQMGFYEHDEFLNIAKKCIKKNSEDNTLTDEELDELYPYQTKFSYEDLIGKEFYYFPHDAIYSYENITNKEYDEVTIVLQQDGKIYTLTYDEDTDTLQGVYLETAPFSYSVVYLQRQGSKPSSITDANDIVNGTWAGIIGDMNHYMILKVDQSSVMTNNMVWLTDDVTSFNPLTNTPSILNMNVKVSHKTDYVTGYTYSATIDVEDMLANPEKYGGFKMTISGILRPKEETSFGCLSRGVYYTDKFAEKYISDASTSEIICNEDYGFKAYIGSSEESSSCFKAYVTFNYLDHSDNNDQGVWKTGYASCLNGDLNNSFSSLFSSLTGVDYYEQDQVYLRSLSGLKVTETSEGYSFDKLPKEIEIYPINFEAKDNITTYLDKWNEDGDITTTYHTLASEDRAELTYTDTIAIIITVINTLVNTITIALVAFTSLSLVVSCFMIAVITYISVMERVKEIGVIRSLGGRKKDISRLFISETFMTGLASGIFGIAVTFGLCTILNLIIAKFNVGNIGALTPQIAIIMVLLSVVLSVLSGLIPSMKASNQDPVVALRSE